MILNQDSYTFNNHVQTYAIDRSVVVSEIIDGEAVIINLDTGKYYSLNETGSVLWGHLLAESMDLQGLIMKLGEHYVLPPDISGIILFALQQWMKEGLVIPADSPTSMPELRVEVNPSGLPEFTPPELEIHTDMQDFLLVDPIHEVDSRGHAAPHHK